MKRNYISRQGTGLKICLTIIMVASFGILLLSCTDVARKPPLFERLGSKSTGIDFKNEIIEDDTYNFLDFSNIYTGSGVGIGDFNKDGLPDIFFGGCMESSRLYLNNGNLKFEDVTEMSGLETTRWVTGVSVVDINADGWDDLYLSVSGIGSPNQLRNLLYINNGEGIKKDSDPTFTVTFTESAESYGIADASQCTHANFFDYDKDGDLDLFLIVNPPDLNLTKVNNVRSKKLNGQAQSTDKLYRNNTITNDTVNANSEQSAWVKPKKKFTDVSKEAGILIEGYSLGMNICDLNEDGWPDIYITNDYLSDDIIYMNNKDGTFTDKASEMLRHTSYASMGMDIADIDNDGNPEIYVLDMLPEDNYRQKMIVPVDNYNRFESSLRMGYNPQYSRNTLQLNNGNGTFSEVGQQFNVDKTDWSWSALLADYDNDGFRDLFVTNGFKRDLGNLDYIVYGDWNPFGSPEEKRERQLDLILKQKGGKIPNYVFQNQYGKGFVKKSEEWGISEPSWSYGAAYTDLDLDGDLDIVVNNLGQQAFIYENRANSIKKNHYLKVKLVGDAKNSNALGAKIWVKYDTVLQFVQKTPFRGYQSSVDPIMHFGLGDHSLIDSVKVVFPSGKTLVKKNIQADTLLVFDSDESSFQDRWQTKRKQPIFFSEVQTQYNISYRHEEDTQVDFDQQLLLPHQHSQFGPSIVAGDVNGDGLEDFFIGGAAGIPGTFFIQGPDGSFLAKEWLLDKDYEDTNALFFDIDQDGDLDLYVCSGGVVKTKDNRIYQDRLYKNDGKGNFSKMKNNLPTMLTSTKAIAAADYDKDGDIDVFIGGRIVPGQYPKAPKSYLLENHVGTLKNVLLEKASKLEAVGMVSDAIWSDYDNDSDLDLILVGEWMPITIFKNNNGELLNDPIEVPNSNGWWNSIIEGDFDGDGDFDYLGGNLGLNTNLKASVEEPIRVYYKDFDANGSIDPIICKYIDGVEHTAAKRDKLIQQLPTIHKRFPSYKKYAETPFEKIFSKNEVKGMNVLQSYVMANSYIENLGNGSFEIRSLPGLVQMAPIKKFLVQDVNKDGHLDALAIGNDYSTEVAIGRYDAATGALLLGDGTGNFKILRGNTSGFMANKNAQSMVTVKMGTKNKELILVGNNSDVLQAFYKE